MTEVQSTPVGPASYPRTIPERITGLQMPPPSSISMPAQSSVTKARKGHLNLDTFSPVNQNGSFEFDRVLKSGYVQKRTRKTKVAPLAHSMFQIRFANRPERPGNLSTSYYGQTFFRYTKTRMKSSSGTRSSSPT
jgi:hypothetical protein